MWLLLLCTNRKSHEEFNCTIRFDVEWPWTAQFHVPQMLKARKRAELGHMLILTVIGNRTICWSSTVPLSDLERLKSRSLRFWVVGDLYVIHVQVMYICRYPNVRSGNFKLWCCLLWGCVRRTSCIILSVKWIRFTLCSNPWNLISSISRVTVCVPQ